MSNSKIKDGKVSPRNGVIHGGHRWGAIIEQGEFERLRVVVAKVREQFSLAVRMDGQKWSSTGYIPKRASSKIVTAGPHGMAVRVNNGAGAMIVNGEQIELDYGWWAFVPANRRVIFESRVVSGMNFHVLYAQLVKG